MDIAKTVLKGNFIALGSYIRKEKSSQISHLSFYFKKPEGFPGGAVVENLPANAGDTGSSPGLGRSHMPRSN